MFRGIAAWSAGAVIASFMCGAMARPAPAQSYARIDSLGVPAAVASDLRTAMAAHDLRRAEALLLPQIQAAGKTPLGDRLLLFIGGVYLLDHDDLNAAIAWKKAEAMEPLPVDISFSLAMAYLQLSHGDWAATRLVALAAADPTNAIYLYWLGRIDYDRHDYAAATSAFKRAIALAPQMSRAWDNLGLCYFFENNNEPALQAFSRAIALDEQAGTPQAWPYVNRAAALRLLGRSTKATHDLRTAITLDPKIAPAHFQLANLLEAGGALEQAVAQDTIAAQIDPAYAEPHAALARLYRRLGKLQLAQQQVALFQHLHGAP